MRDSVRDPVVDSTPAGPPTSKTHRSSSRPVDRADPRDLVAWVAARRSRLRERWSADLRGRNGRWSEPLGEVMDLFLDLLVDMLPATLGPYRHQVEPLWVQTAELYGSFGAMRGLASGEAIEEFQALREALIRLLYVEPPIDAPERLSLRDVLRLNRIVDRGVTQAGVGHTDALFFALFRGNGVPERLDEGVLEEMREQLEAIRGEFDSIMTFLRR